MRRGHLVIISGIDIKQGWYCSRDNWELKSQATEKIIG